MPSSKLAAAELSTLELSGKVAVITGASRGLGAGLAECFVQHGMRVGLCARGEFALTSNEDVLHRRVDVRDPEGVDAFASEVAAALGPIAVWINNAGVLEPIEFVRRLEPAALMDHLAINVVGVLNGSRSYLRHRAELQGGGVLINISSGAALKGYAGWGAYCAGKAAVDRLSECLALEEAASGLRVHAVAPGVIDTAMQQTLRGLTEKQFPQVEKFRQLKRDEAFNTPRFVAQQLLAIAFDPACRSEPVVLRLPEQPRS